MSIRLRLTLLYTAILALTLAILGTILYTSQLRSMRTGEERMLAGMAQRIVGKRQRKLRLVRAGNDAEATVFFGVVGDGKHRLGEDGEHLAVLGHIGRLGMDRRAGASVDRLAIVFSTDPIGARGGPVVGPGDAGCKRPPGAIDSDQAVHRRTEADRGDVARRGAGPGDGVSDGGQGRGANLLRVLLGDQGRRRMQRIAAGVVTEDAARGVENDRLDAGRSDVNANEDRHLHHRRCPITSSFADVRYLGRARLVGDTSSGKVGTPAQSNKSPRSARTLDGAPWIHPA